jgi:4-diphosphocytidyl-2-C-methyl-D-erythritol kinase
MLVFPNAKINLGLRVTGRRTDGYHTIESCMYPVGWTDALELLKTKGSGKNKLKFEQYGLSVPGRPENNLCVKAYHMLDAEFDLPPVKLILHKNIPMGAGLGGGSSDAAFSIRIFNDQLGLGLSASRMRSYASKLGSDCAFFISDKPALASGRGEKLRFCEPVLGGLYILIVHPAIHVDTAKAYASLDPAAMKKDEPLEQLITLPVSKWKKYLKNDFESSVFNSFPAIGLLKKKMYELGALYASMSGSGSAVYGLFDSMPEIPSSWKKMKSWKGALS